MERRSDGEMSRLGVNGRMWSWIFSFLSCRNVICKIGDFHFVYRPTTGKCVITHSIQYLYYGYVDDVQGSVTKFADDGTVWHTGKNIPELAEKVTTDVKKIQHNCNKWRLKISLGKTEVTLFQAEEKDDNIV